MEGLNKCLEQKEVKLEDSSEADTSVQSMELHTEDVTISETKMTEGLQQGRGSVHHYNCSRHLAGGGSTGGSCPPHPSQTFFLKINKTVQFFRLNQAKICQIRRCLPHLGNLKKSVTKLLNFSGEPGKICRLWGLPLCPTKILATCLTVSC